MNNIKFWDRLSNNYDKQVNLVFADAYNQMVKLSKPYLDKSFDVLDIGCGTGITTIKIAPFVKSVLATDVSNKMLNIAKQKSKENNQKNIKFSSNLIFDNYFKENQFDVVFAFNLLCYIENEKEFLKRISYLLKPNGTLISVSDCIEESKQFSAKLTKVLSKVGVFPKMNFYSFASLKDLFLNIFSIEMEKNLCKKNPNYFIVCKN